MKIILEALSFIIKGLLKVFKKIGGWLNETVNIKRFWKIACIILFIGLSAFCVESYVRTRTAKNELRLAVQSIERIRSNSDIARAELESAIRERDSAFSDVQYCSELLKECETRIGNCENSLDGIEQCIRIYEVTLAEMSRKLRECQEGSGKQ